MHPDVYLWPFLALRFLISLQMKETIHSYARAASRDFLEISTLCSLFLLISARLIPAIAFWTLKDFLPRRLLFSAAYSSTHPEWLPQPSYCYVSKQSSIEYEQVSSSGLQESSTCGWWSAQAKDYQLPSRTTWPSLRMYIPPCPG